MQPLMPATMHLNVRSAYWPWLCACADELLIWREIGFNLCLHRHHQLHSLAALPQ